MGIKGIKTGKLISDAERKKLKKLGSNIRKYRNALQWTLEDIEDNRGYQGTWQHWREVECGMKNINITTLLRMAKLLKIKPADLLEGLK